MPYAAPAYISPSFKFEGRLVKKINDFQFNLTVSVNNVYSIVDTANEDPGELQGFRVVTNRPELIMRVIVYGDTPTPDVINTFTMAELLSRGAGLTPGEVETTIQQRSKDPMGTPNGLYPWLARYKDEVLADYLGFEDRRIVLMYTPTIYDQYTRLVVDLVNTNTEEAAVVNEISVRRLAYQEQLDNTTPPRVGNRGPHGNVTPEVSQTQSNMEYGDAADPTPTPPASTPTLHDTIS